MVGRRLTIDEFLKLPEEKPYLELEDGVVVQKAWANPRHGRLQPVFAGHVSDFARPRHLALTFLELQTNFGGNILTPDIAVYRWSRVPRDADGRLVDDIPGAPDIAAEIASPEQSTNALVRRCLWYVENGVHVAPLIDPDDDSVIVFRPDTSPRALRGADRIDLDDVLPGFELTVQELFDSLKLD